MAELYPRSTRKRHIPTPLAALIAGMDMLAVIAAFCLTIQLPQWIPIIEQLPGVGKSFTHLTTRFSFYAFLFAVIMVRFYHRGHYTRRIPWWGQVGFMMEMSFVMMVLDGFTHFLFQLPFSPYLIFGNWLLTLTCLLTFRRAAFSLVQLSANWRLPVILIGDRDIVTDTIYALYADGFTGYEIKEIIVNDKNPEPFSLDFVPKDHPAIKLHHFRTGIQDFMRQNPDFFYILSIEDIRGERRDEMMRTLHRQRIPYSIIPPMRRLHLHGMEPHYFFGNDIMFLHQRDRIATLVGAGVKRVIDVFATAFALPVIAILGIIVYVNKKTSGSDAPVFYGGERIGKRGKHFRCWKFCTMRRDADQILGELLDNDPAAKAEWEQFEKLKNDPRIDCHFSKLLRKTSLDELPQLWSIFIGDMSLVGPRPILESQINTYGEALRYYESVRPGLTGLWQVSGRNETSFKRRIDWDIWYVQNWVLWHDIVILFKTVRVFLTGRGAC